MAISVKDCATKARRSDDSAVLDELEGDAAAAAGAAVDDLALVGGQASMGHVLDGPAGRAAHGGAVQDVGAQHIFPLNPS